MLRVTRSTLSLNTFNITFRPIYECIKKLSTQQKMQDDDEDMAESPKQEMDDFTREFLDKRIKITEFQRILLAAGSSITALLDPTRQDMIACLGETTGEESLRRMLKIMQSNAEGQEILSQKPRINTQTVNLETLKSLPNDSFGYQYFKFLDDNQVTPDSRLDVRFMNDPQLAYTMTRYRETHDLVHTILGMPTNMLGEVAVKWVEAINIGLPMCYGGALFGAMRLRPKQRALYREHYLSWAIETGRQVKPLISVYWEKRWEQKIEDLRKELNIKTLDLPKK